MASIVLITGANGFIGSYTTLLFESQGERVVAIDVMPRSNDLSLLPIRTATTILDVTDSIGLRELCKKEKVTHIIHTAHPHREENPEVLNFCLQAMRNLLESAKEGGVKRVVFSSSGAVYGPIKTEEHRPIKEDDPVGIYPTFLYRSAKILGESLGDFYAEHHGLSFVSLRYSSVYGPGETRGIGLAIKDGILGKPCRLYLTRVPDDLIFVKDVARAIRIASFHEQPVSRAFNIAGGRAYFVSDLQEAMRKHLPEVSLEMGKPPDHATVNRFRQRDILDVTRAREELGFVPQFDLDSGIAEIAAWVRSEKKHLKGGRNETSAL